MVSSSRKRTLVRLVFSLMPILFLVISCGPTQYSLSVVHYDSIDPIFVKLPVPPVQPDPELASLESVVNTDPIINSYKQGGSITPQSTIGVMDFKSSSKSGSGTLVADTFSISFLNRSVSVVERQNIKKITEEQMMTAEGMQRLSDAEIAKRIGQLTRADFILFGAVTQYHFENRKLPIPYILPEEKMREYLADMETYKSAAESFENQQEKNDEMQFLYINEDLMAQLQHLDVASLNKLSALGPTAWRHQSAVNLQWNYPYFKSRKVLPIIGEDIKELQYKRQKLEQEISAWEDSFKTFLKKHDEAISATDVKDFYKSYKKYNKSLTKRMKEKKKGKKPGDMTEIFDDEYIQRSKRFCARGTEKLKEYFDLNKKYKAYELKPIPEKQRQFNLPGDKDSFVSVANLGITFKIIDIKTGEIVWIGQASKRDLNIQKGLNKMVEAVVDDIVSMKK